MFNWFKKDEADITFKDMKGTAVTHFPIRSAKREPLAFIQQQKEATGRFKFHNCPGMIDYAQYGYILPAWQTIKIKANKAGTSVFYYDRVTGRSNDCAHPAPMATDIVNGTFDPEDGVKLQPFKCDSPWRVVCKKDISALLLPATFHSKFLHDLYVYPGIVNYNSFKAMNFIFAAKRECEVTIEAGEPLLHIIPFLNKSISAGYGLASPEDIAEVHSPVYSAINHLYRKLNGKYTSKINRMD